MTKRVAWFTGQASSGAVTPHKVYEIFNEDDDSFNLKDNTGDTRFCLKQGCAHICHWDWVFADIVEEVKEATTEVVEQTKLEKVKKWSKWIPNTTGKQPVDDGIIVKTRFARGSLDKGRADAYWWADKALTHYKVKLKDQLLDKQEKQKSKWTKNTGVCPVDGNVKVEIKMKNGDKEGHLAKYFSWSFDDQEWDIIKWRLAD